VITTLKSALKPLKFLFQPNPDRFLAKVRGVIHIGANTGQERKIYDRHQLQVLWIEPIPEIFNIFQTNIRQFPKQRAIQRLVTDRDNQTYPFHIANNAGSSSSILALKLHQDIWPQVAYEKTITLQSKTLPSLLAEEQIDIADYDALVLDTQGAELLILKGAVPVLQHFSYIKVEVPDFESYAGCCQLKDLETFLASQGYCEQVRRRFAKHPSGGSYYDIVYRKVGLKD